MGKISAGDIPGYAEALAGEIKNREIAYLGVEWDVCGVALKPMTPEMLCELSLMRSPFICGGFPTAENIAHFLAVCGQTQKQRGSKVSQWLFARKLRKALRSREWTLEDCAADIDQYVGAMFQDSPSGGSESIPYASAVAWLEFTMTGKPWQWSRAQTMATPIPIIYQQIRCLERSRGISPVNQSDIVRDFYIRNLNMNN